MKRIRSILNSQIIKSILNSPIIKQFWVCLIIILNIYNYIYKLPVLLFFIMMYFILILSFIYFIYRIYTLNKKEVTLLRSVAIEEYKLEIKSILVYAILPIIFYSVFHLVINPPLSPL